MDYSHSPGLIYLMGGAGVLMGVLVAVMAFLMFRRPRPPAGPPGPTGPPAAPVPPARRGSGPGASHDAGGDPGDVG
jgi:hypothetical protein